MRIGDRNSTPPCFALLKLETGYKHWEVRQGGELRHKVVGGCWGESDQTIVLDVVALEGWRMGESHNCCFHKNCLQVNIVNV